MLGLAELREMKKFAYGNPAAIAKYTLAQREYDDMVTTLFPEDAPIKFADSPAEWYVKDAEKRAQETGDTDDIARAVILRDRYAAYEEGKTAHIKVRETTNDLRAKLQTGDQISANDVESAWRLAKLNSSADNLSLYSQIKQQHENPTKVNPAPEAVKVTNEDVERAREKAKRTGSTRDIAEYAVLKRNQETSESTES